MIGYQKSLPYAQSIFNFYTSINANFASAKRVLSILKSQNANQKYIDHFALEKINKSFHEKIRKMTIKNVSLKSNYFDLTKKFDFTFYPSKIYGIGVTVVVKVTY